MKSRWTLAILVLGLAAAPGSADAQLKKILNKAKGQLSGKKGDSATTTDKSAAPADAPAATAPATAAKPFVLDEPTFADFLVTLRLDADRRKALLAYNQASARYSTCSDSVRADRAAWTRRYPANPEADKAKTEYERLAARFQDGSLDETARAAAYDSMSYALKVLMHYQSPPLAKCGLPVRAPEGLQESVTDGDGKHPFKPVGPSPELPKGMTAQQYGRTRERVAAYLLTKGTFTPGFERLIFTEAERAVVDNHLAELQPFLPYFQEEAMPYLAWGDVWDWKR
ncbi:MAG: hypothetical protein AB7L66_23035 [Gemmatimonadales bacterium]